MRPFGLAFAAVLAVPTLGPAADAVDYRRDVKPILQERCYACHGALKQQAKLRLDSGARVRKGGSSGPAVVAGNPGVTGRGRRGRNPVRRNSSPWGAGRCDQTRPGAF